MDPAASIEQLDGSEIAIIGMAGRFPGARDLDAFWRNLRDGVESISFFSDDEIERSDINQGLLDNPNYVKAGPVLEDIDLFDAAFFGYTHREAEIMDPQQRLLMECAWESLEHAGYDPETYRHPIGVFAGARTSSYKFNLYLNPGILRSFGTIHIGLGNDLSYLSTRIAYKLNLRGPSYSLQTACSTSLVAVHLACQSLLLDECRMALAGGVVVSVPHKHGYLYQEGGMESPDGHCRTFDAAAQGTVFGNGLGMVVLKRLTDALADGDFVHAVIRGSATNNDGSGKASFTAPGVGGQLAVIAQALDNAGIDPATIEYVEAHGTGTPIGDPIEVRALTRAFRAGTDKRGFCALGSLKPNIGHLDAAAGIAGLIKTILALKHKQIPPLLHFQTLNPAIDLADSPFYINTDLREWPANGHPRRAAISSFGAGGANAHAILEEAPTIAPSGPSRPRQLLLISARTAAALDAATANLAAHLRAHPDQPLADIAYTLQVGRKRFDHRRALVARDHADALAALGRHESNRLLDMTTDQRERPVMFLFPGQGSQYAGMARGLYQTEPLFRKHVDRCAEILRSLLGLDLRDLLYPATGGEGRRTDGASRGTGNQGQAAGELDQTARDLTQAADGLSSGAGKLDQTARDLTQAADGLSSGAGELDQTARDLTPGADGLSSTADEVDQTARLSSLAKDERRKTKDESSAIDDGAPSSFVVGPSSELGVDLNQTWLAQPALFVIEYALAQLWMSWGVVPQAMIGHSVGEYVAATIAGVFTLDHALDLVVARGKLMQQVAPGGMLSVQLPAAQVEPLLGDDLDLAAINGPALCVVAGPDHAIDRLAAQLAGRGVEQRRLHTSHAFHSSMMDAVVAPFRERLRRTPMRPPALPYRSNLTGDWITDQQATDPEYWVAHLRQPVRFADGVAALLDQPDAILLEVGPGKMLGSLAMQHPAHASEQIVLASLRHPYDEQDDDAFLLAALGRLWLAGARIDWAGMHDGERRLRLPLPTYPFERQRYWIAQGQRQISAPAAPLGEREAHPLLGRRLPATPPILQYETELRADEPSYLRDHQIQGVVLLPAAGYIEMALAAAARLPGAQEYVVADVSIEQALVVVPGEAQSVQITLVPEGPDRLSFGVYSSPEATRDQPDRWTIHARGALRRDPPAADDARAAEDIDAIKRRCAETVGANEIYPALRDRGFQFGPTFQGIEQIWRRDGEALARIQIPAELAEESGAYRIHPALLDACLQALSATLPASMRDAESADSFLPVGFDSVRLHQQPGARLWSHVLLRPVELTPGTLAGDLWILDERGAIVAELSGIKLRRIGQAARIARKSLEDWLYTVEWQARENSAPANAAPGGFWLILADAGGVGRRLAARLERRGDVCTLVGRARQPQDDLAARTIDPADPAQVQRLIDEMAELHQEDWRGVALFWNLDAPPSERLTVDNLADAQTIGSVAALHLVHALAGKGLAELPRLWLVTRGAQAVGDEPREIAVAQAPVWGLGRVITLEHPELRCARLDLDPDGDEGEADLLAHELRAPDGEDQIALRDGRRYVARLRSYALPVAPTAPAAQPGARLALPPSESFALVVGEPGNLHDLRLQAVARRAPGPGEVEIAVRASGLNFKDLMGALGLLPIGARLTSGEYAGVIARIGPGVAGLSPGDEVIALSDVSFSSFAVVPAGNVMPKPKRLSFEEAVTIPVAFLTAYYGLHHLARLAKGERVLIHSAAGGLGLAAVQIAQAAGAEIFATAGSPEKRAFLESLGIERVFDSRTTAFAEEILRQTSGEGVDVILNSLSGEAIGKGLAILRPFGRFIDVTKLDIYQNSQVGLYPFYKNLAYHSIDIGWIVRDRPDLARELFAAILGQIEAGALNPLPLRAYPIQDAPEAFLRMAQRKNVGKLALTMPDTTGAPAFDATRAVRPDATYLITGGLGGLGLRVARWMAEQGAGAIVLTGRSAGSPVAQQTVGELEGGGARVVVARADVSSRDDLIALLARIDHDLPPLRGVIHAAGALDDGALLQLDAQRFARVMAPKAGGAWNLHELTADLALDFFVLFSSSAAVFGSPGQGNYVAANAFLDALAWLRRRQGRPALSINWGAWADVGMAADTMKDNKLLAGQDVPLIRPAQGVELLGRLLRLDAAQVIVLPAPARELLALYPRGAELPMFAEIFADERAGAARPGSALRARPDLPAAYVAPRTDIEQAAAEIWQTVLGIEPVGVDDNFFDLGGHSLLASQLIRLLCQAFAVDLPLRSLYKAPTIAELAPLIEDALISEIDALDEDAAARSLQELA